MEVAVAVADMVGGVAGGEEDVEGGEAGDDHRWICFLVISFCIGAELLGFLIGLPTLASIIDQTASQIGFTCIALAIVCTRRTRANAMMMNPRLKISPKANFCLRVICSFQSTLSGSAMTTRKLVFKDW